jgi:hypothetical protein
LFSQTNVPLSAANLELQRLAGVVDPAAAAYSEYIYSIGHRIAYEELTFANGQFVGIAIEVIGEAQWIWTGDTYTASELRAVVEASFPHGSLLDRAGLSVEIYQRFDSTYQIDNLHAELARVPVAGSSPGKLTAVGEAVPLGFQSLVRYRNAVRLRRIQNVPTTGTCGALLGLGQDVINGCK